MYTLFSKDENYIYFIKNSKCGIVNKKELKYLILSKKATVTEINKYSDFCGESSDSLISYFIDKYCKIQTTGTFLSMDCIIKSTVLFATPDSLKIAYKKNLTILGAEKIAYLMEI
ncbi:hypothetical protein LQZ18_04645 [Lachnospiraceae bacterium ZAX-1]